MSDINLKSIPEEKNPDEKVGFKVHHIEEDVLVKKVEVSAETKVIIKFGKFVELVAKHSFVDVVEKNADEEIIINANLLADLANADEEKETIYQRWTLVGIGLILGVLIAYIIMK